MFIYNDYRYFLGNNIIDKIHTDGLPDGHKAETDVCRTNRSCIWV